MPLGNAGLVPRQGSWRLKGLILRQRAATLPYICNIYNTCIGELYALLYQKTAAESTKKLCSYNFRLN